MSRVCLHGKNFNVGHCTQTIQSNCVYLQYLSSLLTSAILYHFIDLDLVWGSQGLCKAKPIGFIFSHTFDLIRMKSDVLMKQFKLNIMRLVLIKIYLHKGKISAVLQTALETFNAGMHSDVYVLI